MKRLYLALMALAMVLAEPLLRLFRKKPVPLALQFFADPALENVSAGFNVSDVVAAVVTTASKSYLFDTASEFNAKPKIEAGQEKTLRKLNTILALNKTEDIVTGYDIDLTDVLMHPELFALVDGGVSTFAGEPAAFTGYAAPVTGQPVTRTPFRLDLYTAIKDTDGETTGYLKWMFPGCKGKPVEPSVKDGDFYMPKLSVQSRPATGESPLEIAPVTNLPTVS